jgi:hypothetical protein
MGIAPVSKRRSASNLRAAHNVCRDASTLQERGTEPVMPVPLTHLQVYNHAAGSEPLWPSTDTGSDAHLSKLSTSLLTWLAERRGRSTNQATYQRSQCPAYAPGICPCGGGADLTTMSNVGWLRQQKWRPGFESRRYQGEVCSPGIPAHQDVTNAS